MEYKTFKVGDLFDLQAPKGDIQIKKVKEGTVPFVSTADENNGIQAYIDDNADGKSIKFKAKQITMSILSKAFYQPDDFFGIGHGVLWVLSCKAQQLSELQSLYICTLINQYRDKYDYVTKLNASKAAATEIQLPVTESGEPDWQYMEQYMQQIMTDIQDEYTTIKEYQKVNTD